MKKESDVTINSMEFTAIVRKGEKLYVSLCPEVDVVSQGATIEESIENLKEAVELYIEEMGLPDMPTAPVIARFTVDEHAKAA